MRPLDHLYLEIHGPESGPAVVLLHHGLGSTRAWRKQVPALAEAGYRVIVYDRWGYGQSDPRPHLDVPAFRDDLADLQTLLDTLHLPRVTLIGHSDGSTIALYYAAQNPTRVSALVSVAAHIYLEPQLEIGVEGVRQAFEQDQRFRAGFLRAHGDKFEAVFHNWFEGWHNLKALEWDMRPLLSQITCPTLVIQGEQDELATPQHACDIAASIFGAELWLLPGAAHMLPQDLPDIFNNKLLEFLSVL
jgi:pimeloyl-ACP methyl ester carboxylesterase